MKAISLIELENFVEVLDSLLAKSQLQEVIANDRGLALGFYKNALYWLIIDLQPNSPICLIFENTNPWKKGSPKPTSLFLSAHGKNLYFENINFKKNLGRVFEIVLKKHDSICKIEIQLIPKQPNILVRTTDKSISWSKPKELTEIILSEEKLKQEIETARDLETIHNEWIQEREKSPQQRKDPFAVWLKQKEKDLTKKRKALEEMKKNVSEYNESLWRPAGEWIKTHGNLKVPHEYLKYIDPNESLSKNIELCFSKAKQEESKKEGTLQRIQIIESEIERLESSEFNQKAQNDINLKNKTHRKLDGEIKTRKLKLTSGLNVYLGKSAKDNLDLLRKSKSWDIWLHLKDYPGTHAIIHKEKNQSVPFPDLKQAAHWVAEESLSKKTLSLGQRIEVIWTECRFVKPIKGDKLGRVNYSSEHHFIIEFEP